MFFQGCYINNLFKRSNNCKLTRVFKEDVLGGKLSASEVNYPHYAYTQ